MKIEKNTQIFKISSFMIPLKVLRISIDVVTAVFIIATKVKAGCSLSRLSYMSSYTGHYIIFLVKQKYL